MTTHPKCPHPALPRSPVPLLALATALAILQSRPTPASAAADTWTAGSGNWSTPANWSTNTVPGANDNVNITETDGANRTITYDYTGPSAYVSWPHNQSLPMPPTLRQHPLSSSMTANNLSASQEVVGGPNFGSIDTGSFSQSGGNNSVSSLTIGDYAGTSGFYTLSGNGTLSAGTEYVGFSGNGTFTQTSASNKSTFDLYPRRQQQCQRQLHPQRQRHSCSTLLNEYVMAIAAATATFTPVRWHEHDHVRISLPRLQPRFQRQLATSTATAHSCRPDRTMSKATLATAPSLRPGGTNIIGNSLLFDGVSNSTGSYSLSKWLHHRCRRIPSATNGCSSAFHHGLISSSFG